MTDMLAGYRVLDLCDAKGVLCTKIMADLGADVITVEPPRGSATRNYPPFYHDQADSEKSLFYWYFHTNKRSVTMNLETADGQELFKALVKTADILVETFAPGYLGQLGLGYAQLRTLHPGLIMTSITGYGQEGPYRDYRMSDIVGLAMGGLMQLCGDPEGAPVPPGGDQGNHLAALNGVTGSLIALWYREISGQGQHIDVSLQAAVANTLETTHQTYDFNREIRTRLGDRREGAAYILSCRDGYIALLCAGSLGWPKVAAWLQDEGCDNGLADERFVDDIYRYEHDAEVHATLQSFFSTKCKADIYAEAQRRRIPLAPVNTPRDLVESPQLRARGFFVDVAHPELEATITYPGEPYKLSETPWRIRRRPPTLGEHNEDVYGRELGLSRDDLIALRAAGAI